MRWQVRRLRCCFTSCETAQALVATADLHSADEAAKRVLPAVTPLAVDTVADVRTHALTVLDRYRKTLKEEHSRLAAAAEAAGAEEAQPGGARFHPGQALRAFLHMSLPACHSRGCRTQDMGCAAGESPCAF